MQGQKRKKNNFVLDRASGRSVELISGVPLFLCISHTKRNRGEAFGRFGYDTRYSGRMFGPETVRSTKYGRYIILHFTVFGRSCLSDSFGRL